MAAMAATRPRRLRDDETLLGSYATMYSPTRQVSAKEELQRIEAAILELPEAQRDVVMMSRVMDLSYAEIAAALMRVVDQVQRSRTAKTNGAPEGAG